MTARIRLKIVPPVGPALIHRFRNLGEDLYRALEHRARIDMNKVDAATGEFLVEVPKTRDIGDVTAIIKKQLALHAKDGAFVLERL